MQDAFAMLETTVLQAVDPTWAGESAEIVFLTPASSAAQQSGGPDAGDKNNPPKNDGNRGKAEAIIAQVYDMLEHNDVQGAFKRFDREKSFLKKNLDKDAYDMLNATVSQANQK
jgi:hypothetical protein